MWRNRYRPLWRVRHDLLLIVLDPLDGTIFALPPIGIGEKPEAVEHLMSLLSEHFAAPRVCRVGKAFAEQQVDTARYRVSRDPDNDDYVYLTENLINLPGNKYHRKKNHVNRFKKSYSFEYRELDKDLVCQCLELQESWCEVRDCGENPALLAEDMAVYEALKHHDELAFQGGAILIDSKVEAFSLGEMLNADTAVIHIEKANPDISGLYAVINQMFCQEAFADAKFINREQDLGIEGLRKAKQSYYPDHMVEKFTVTPR